MHRLKIFFVAFGFAFAEASALAHTHSHKAHSVAPEVATSADMVAFKEMYDREVRPIFSKKCMDCHSSDTYYPWYYYLPVAKQVIDRDIKEAQKHLDISRGYPFVSHASPREDLEEIEKVIREGEMPPWRYRLFHPGSTLSEQERTTIKQWTAIGLKMWK